MRRVRTGRAQLLSGIAEAKKSSLFSHCCAASSAGLIDAGESLRGSLIMPSFDVVSEFDMHEVSNAVSQANKEVDTRFDFKGTNSKFEHNEMQIMLDAEVDFQLTQMLDILQNKLIKRGIDTACMKAEEPVESGKRVKQEVILQQGISSELARKMVKFVKASKLKVQVAIQGEKLRVTGKKRDDLQAVIAALKEENWEIPLQYENFRD